MLKQFSEIRHLSASRYLTPRREADRRVGPEDEQQTSDCLQSSRAKQTSRFRTGLLLVSSAALGGIAVAVWNRRLLRELRTSLESASGGEPAAEIPGSED